MANYYLQVDKNLFNMGLTPVEILLIAQIAEFQRNTGDCFMSDKALADNFGVSESTIKRELKRLEELGFISRDTKNVKGGRERHMTVNQDKINEELTKRNLSLVNTNKAQNEPCTSVKMSFDKGQIDTIKDNINKIIEKDNNSGVISANAESNPLQDEPEEGKVTNPIVVDVEWLREQYRNNPNEWISKPACNCVLHKPSGKHYRRKD